MTASTTRARWLQALMLGLAFAATGSACGAQDTPAPDPRLAALPIAPDAVTVSGISAGGYMAVQFHVAHSALVRGVGVLAAGPYYCAQNSMLTALGPCMKADPPIDAAALADLTRRFALEGAIDPIAGLAGDRVWIFHGGADGVVAKPVVDALQAYYATFVDPGDIVRVELPSAGHTFPASAEDLPPCGTTAPPFIGNCGIDGARQLLEALYGPLTPNGAAPGDLRTFPQAAYATQAGAEGLAPTGWLYVPSDCEAGKAEQTCRLHVVFHGCKQGASFVEDTFVRRSGYLAAADAGRIVLLFPQVAPTLRPLNPNGCWDWWGYEGAAYATRRGPQIAAVRAMIADLVGDQPTVAK